MSAFEKALSEARVGSEELDELLWGVLEGAPKLPFTRVLDAATELFGAILNGLEIKIPINEPGGLWVVAYDNGGIELLEEWQMTVTGPPNKDPQRIEAPEGAALRRVKDTFKMWKAYTDGEKALNQLV